MFHCNKSNTEACSEATSIIIGISYSVFSDVSVVLCTCSTHNIATCMYTMYTIDREYM